MIMHAVPVCDAYSRKISAYELLAFNTSLALACTKQRG